MNDISGTSDYDVARNLWGGSWRLPTRSEIKELLDNCDYEWTIYKGIKGGLFTSKKNGKKLFLPAADHRGGSSLDHTGVGGFHWSSTPDEDDDYAYGLGFDANGDSWGGWYYRYRGLSVRPVSE